MANFNSLKATIDAQIKANGVQAITGPILNAVLTAMINTIGNGYSLQGSVAQTTDNPGAPDNLVAYLAAGPGTYTNFGGTVIPDDGHAYLLTWDTSWHAVQLPLPTYDLANGKQDKATGDTAGHVAVMDGNGNSVDGGTALTDLATKAEVEAVEQEVAQIAGEAGLAEAVIDTDGAGTEQEFTFRKSGGDGGAYYRKIKGKTIVVDGELASNDADAVETTGANQWDEANLVKGKSINWQTGAEDYSPGYSHTGYLPVIPNTSYYFRLNGNEQQWGAYYDADKNYISGANDFLNNIFTTPANAAYVRISIPDTQISSLCINLSNPAINGQYFPYWKRTLQLGLTTKEDTDGNVPFADGMKGAGTAADWADKVGGEKRMKRVNLGDLEWGYSTSYDGYFYATPPSPLGSSNLGVCSRYTYDGGFFGSSNDKVWIPYQFFGTICVRDSSFNGDAAAFKAAMDGVFADYELATPVPFTWKEPLNLGVKVDENGTERAIAPEGATEPSAPFVADTTYTMSIARMVAILQGI